MRQSSAKTGFDQYAIPAFTLTGNIRSRGRGRGGGCSKNIQLINKRILLFCIENI
jgi:hypothetical protein